MLPRNCERRGHCAQSGVRWARCCTGLRLRLLTNVFSFSLTFFSQPSPLISFQYCGFLCLFVIILLGVGIGVYAKKDSASIYMQEGWCAASPSVQADIQTHFLCCGLNYFNDSVARWEDGAQVYPACQDPKQRPVYGAWGTEPGGRLMIRVSKKYHVLPPVFSLFLTHVLVVMI